MLVFPCPIVGYNMFAMFQLSSSSIQGIFHRPLPKVGKISRSLEHQRGKSQTQPVHLQVAVGRPAGSPHSFIHCRRLASFVT